MKRDKNSGDFPLRLRKCSNSCEWYKSDQLLSSWTSIQGTVYSLYPSCQLISSTLQVFHVLFHSQWILYQTFYDRNIEVEATVVHCSAENQLAHSQEFHLEPGTEQIRQLWGRFVQLVWQSHGKIFLWRILVQIVLCACEHQLPNFQKVLMKAVMTVLAKMNLALGELSIKYIYPYNKQNDHWKIDNLLKILPVWRVCHYWRNCSRNDQICLLSLEDSEMKEKQKQSIKQTNPLQNEIDWSVLRTDMIAKKQKSSSLKILDKYCGVHTFLISLIATVFFYFQCVLELWG